MNKEEAIKETERALAANNWADTLKHCHQILEFLKTEPEPGEFTKNLHIALGEVKKLRSPSLRWLLERLLECCDRNDRLEAKLKEQEQKRIEEQKDIDKCQFCGACRLVRPSGKWQYNCHCDDPANRPNMKTEPEGFTKNIRAKCLQAAENCLKKDLYEACDRIDRLEAKLEEKVIDLDCMTGERDSYFEETQKLEAQLKAKDERIAELKGEINKYKPISQWDKY